MSDDRPLSAFVLQDRWQFIAEVGRGSDGVVYSAVDRQTQQVVAVKVYTAWLGLPLDQMQQRITAEAAVMNAVQSPHIVRCQHVGLARAAGGQPAAFLVMDLLDGQTLRQWMIGRGIVRPDRATQVLRLVCEALASIHLAGYAHLDLKPENIFLQTVAGQLDPHVWLLDLTNARATGAPAVEAGRVRGTPVYAAPEVCLRTGTLGPPADVYAVGIMLYEMLTGETPLTGTTVEQIVAEHAYGSLRSLPRDHEASGLVPLYRRCTARVPWDRYPDASALATALGTPPRRTGPQRPIR